MLRGYTRSKFKERHKESSFLMVSHSLNSLKEFCDVAIVFKDDNVVSFHEDVQEGIEEYITEQNNY